MPRPKQGKKKRGALRLGRPGPDCNAAWRIGRRTPPVPASCVAGPGNKAVRARRPAEGNDGLFFPLLGALSRGGERRRGGPGSGESSPPTRSPRGVRQRRPTPNKWAHPGIDCRGGAGSIPSVRFGAGGCTQKRLARLPSKLTTMYYSRVASTITRVVGLELLSTVPTLLLVRTTVECGKTRGEASS